MQLRSQIDDTYAGLTIIDNGRQPSTTFCKTIPRQPMFSHSYWEALIQIAAESGWCLDILACYLVLSLKHQLPESKHYERNSLFFQKPIYIPSSYSDKKAPQCDLLHLNSSGKRKQIYFLFPAPLSQFGLVIFLQRRYLALSEKKLFWTSLSFGFLFNQKQWELVSKGQNKKGHILHRKRTTVQLEPCDPIACLFSVSATHMKQFKRKRVSFKYAQSLCCLTKIQPVLLEPGNIPTSKGNKNAVCQKTIAN